jgi:hypothetical protein
MKPQFQTDTGEKTGNCWSACIASILEIPLDTVPNFCGGSKTKDHWWSETQQFLDSLSLTVIEITILEDQDVSTIFDCYWIASGKSPRYSGDHAVVYHGNKMVHDPHPDGTGIDGPIKTGAFLVAKDPSKTLNQVRSYTPLLEE